jgi:cytoskeletal protein CcmA (bactofilin family)
LNKKIFLNRRFLLLVLLVCVVALAPTITGSGNWSDSSNWSGGDIGDAITEDVTMNNNTGTITIQNGESYTIGAFNMNNGNTLTIDAGGSLVLGSSTDLNNLITNNSTTINVDGDLEIWGDLVVNNNLTLNVTGNLIIHGDLDINNSAALAIDVSGEVTVEGNFNGGNNTDVEVDGTLNVEGDINVGSGSELTGSGTVNLDGTCSGPDTFCASGPLPIELLFFKVEAVNKQVHLTWATASEENFDFFSIERSEDGQEYYEIGVVPGNGFSDEMINYEYLDQTPLPGRSFYRLKAVDFDGSFEYFQIESVIFDQLGVDIYPNPVSNDQLSVWVNFENNLPIKLTIYDSKGKLITRHPLESGLNRLNLGELSPGSFIVVINSGVLEHRSKLIVQ